jgi:hypothetical protein
VRRAGQWGGPGFDTPQVANPCAYVGYQLDFSQTKLQQLYRNHAGYVASVGTAANKLVGEHWLLTASASDLIAEAKGSSVLQSP